MEPTIKLSSPATHNYWEIPVLYQDEDLLAMDKPAGLPTVSEPHQPERPSLMPLLHQAIRDHKPWVREWRVSHLSNPYRLDPETSGVLLLARSKEVLSKITAFLGSEQPAREYLALVQGTPENPAFDIEANVGPNLARPGRMRVDPHGGKRARTQFEVRETLGKWSLVRCRPLTDRLHQIRVHVRYAGYPVVGDSLYGGKPLLLSRLKAGYRLKPGREERPLLASVALHAHKLSLPHPITGVQLEITAPLPKDMQVALKYLRKFASGAVAPLSDSP